MSHDSACSQPADDSWQPRRVLLFSGHMVDAAERTPPRFPADKASLAAGKIALTLNQLAADSNDLALTQGACGGVKLQLQQPFAEATFIENSVAPGGPDWVHRYQTISARLANPPLAAPSQLSELPPTMNAYQRCNLWLLTGALAYGAEKLVFICLWDGGEGDAPGGSGRPVTCNAPDTGELHDHYQCSQRTAKS